MSYTLLQSYGESTRESRVTQGESTWDADNNLPIRVASYTALFGLLSLSIRPIRPSVPPRQLIVVRGALCSCLRTCSHQPARSAKNLREPRKWAANGRPRRPPLMIRGHGRPAKSGGMYPRIPDRPDIGRHWPPTYPDEIRILPPPIWFD